MEKSKWFKKEARVIVEMFDDKIPNGLVPGSKLNDDWGGLTHIVDERHASFLNEKREKIIDFIALKYEIDIKLETQEIDIGDRNIKFFEYYPTKFAGTQSLRDLSDMSSDYFREKVGEVLAAIPGGIQFFKEAAEASPYIF